MVVMVGCVVFNFDLILIGLVIVVLSNCVNKVKVDGFDKVGDFIRGVVKLVVMVEKLVVLLIGKFVKVRSGMGFVVSVSGYVVINYYVIDGCIDFKGNFMGEVVVVLCVVLSDVINDFVLL